MPSKHLVFQADFVRMKLCRHGPMIYNLNDRFVGKQLDLYGEFHERQGELLRHYLPRGGWAVDAGANIGVHTIPLAIHAGESGCIVAYEPQRLAFAMLCANVALNALTNVFPSSAALGSASGSIVVPQLDQRRETNFGGLALGAAKEGEAVPVTTIDAADLKRCDLIKIDVEGMEHEVLTGAAATVARCRPVLYVENDRENRSAELIQLVLDLGYRPYWHVSPIFSPDNFFGDPINVFVGIVSVNMLCLPAESEMGAGGLRRVSGPGDDWRG